MAGTLIRVVHLRDAEGRPVTFHPGDEVPGWAQRAITNPAAWDDTGTTGSAASTGTTADRTTKPARPAPVTPAPREPRTGPPPLSGHGSSVGRWRKYAAEQGVTVADTAERDEIIAELRGRGVPVA